MGSMLKPGWKNNGRGCCSTTFCCGGVFSCVATNSGALGLGKGDGWLSMLSTGVKPVVAGMAVVVGGVFIVLVADVRMAGECSLLLKPGKKGK